MKSEVKMMVKGTEQDALPFLNERLVRTGKDLMLGACMDQISLMQVTQVIRAVLDIDSDHMKLPWRLRVVCSAGSSLLGGVDAVSLYSEAVCSSKRLIGHWTLEIPRTNDHVGMSG